MNIKEFQILKPKIYSWVFFLDQICPFSSNNFTDRLVSPNTDWPVTVLPCYIMYHDNQSVILSRSLIATQLQVSPSSLFPCLYVHVFKNHRDRAVSTADSHGGGGRWEEDRIVAAVNSHLIPFSVQDPAPYSDLDSHSLLQSWWNPFGVVAFRFSEMFPLHPSCDELLVTTCSWWSCTSGWAPQSEWVDMIVGPV